MSVVLDHVLNHKTYLDMDELSEGWIQGEAVNTVTKGQYQIGGTVAEDHNAST